MLDFQLRIKEIEFNISNDEIHVLDIDCLIKH